MCEITRYVLIMKLSPLFQSIFSHIITVNNTDLDFAFSVFLFFNWEFDLKTEVQIHFVIIHTNDVYAGDFSIFGHKVPNYYYPPSPPTAFFSFKDITD